MIEVIVAGAMLGPVEVAPDGASVQSAADNIPPVEGIFDLARRGSRLLLMNSAGILWAQALRGQHGRVQEASYGHSRRDVEVTQELLNFVWARKRCEAFRDPLYAGVTLMGPSQKGLRQDGEHTEHGCGSSRAPHHRTWPSQDDPVGGVAFLFLFLRQIEGNLLPPLPHRWAGGQR